ncbi:MAG: hypothetical protein ACYDCK_01545 [Thermoplasmatota archaeon]
MQVATRLRTTPSIITHAIRDGLFDDEVRERADALGWRSPTSIIIETALLAEREDDAGEA